MDDKKEKVENRAGRRFSQWMASLTMAAGLTLIFMGFWVAPEGVIDRSVLMAFGEILVFVGSVMGITVCAHEKIKDKK